EAITRTILMAEAASAFEDLIESGGIAGLTAPEDRFTAYARDAILAKDYIRALRLRALVVREADRVLSGLDALVAPGRAALASPLGRQFRCAAPRHHRGHLGRMRQCRRSAGDLGAERLCRGGVPHKPAVHGPGLGREH